MADIDRTTALSEAVRFAAVHMAIEPAEVTAIAETFYKFLAGGKEDQPKPHHRKYKTVQGLGPWQA